jgi:hypothetical protein
MKNWKTILLVAGILLLVAAFTVYAARISSCYPSAKVWSEFTMEYQSGWMQSCSFESSALVQFALFLILFVPGILLFTVYWLIARPAVKNRRRGMLGAFIILIMFDSLLIMLYGLLGYPTPGNTSSPAGWVVETIAVLGFLCYLSTLAIWHWKRWGVSLFEGASVALAVFILLGGKSLLLAGVIIVGGVGFSILLRRVRNKMV